MKTLLPLVFLLSISCSFLQKKDTSFDNMESEVESLLRTFERKFPSHSLQDKKDRRTLTIKRTKEDGDKTVEIEIVAIPILDSKTKHYTFRYTMSVTVMLFDDGLLRDRKEVTIVSSDKEKLIETLTATVR